MFGRYAPGIGQTIGQHFGFPQTGHGAGMIAGELGQRYIPFGADSIYAPQGVIGGFLGNRLGGWLGGRLGGGLGGAIGSTAGSVLGGLLPFGAGYPIPTYAHSAGVC